MRKNDRDMRECVKHSLDARLSGLTSVPFLEQRVLAGEGKEKRKMRKKRRIVLALALALALLSVTAFAASKLDLFRFMEKVRDPIEPLDGAEALVSTDLGSAENELVTLRVEEAVYDGQGVMVLARLAPKDPEQYALHNSFFLDAPEEEYLVEYMPAEVPEGVYPYANGTMEIRNGPDERALYVDGEPVELPTDRETADAAGLPVYLDGDAMYFTHQESEQITRLDGKQMIFFEVVMAPASEGAEGLANGMSGNAEAQPDGSVLLWFDAFSDAPLPETVEMKLNVSVFLDGEPFPLEDIAFSLDRAEPERTAAFAPEGDGAIGERVRIRAVNMTVTKVRGYLTIDYEYQAAEGEPMGISFRLYDGEGNEIHTGGGHGMFDAETGIYREQQEMQSFDEIPTSLILEVKAIGGEVLGRCTVALQE